MRTLSGEGRTFIYNEEGVRLQAYDDKTGQPLNAGDRVVGVATIGVGHTGPEVVPGLRWTREQVDAAFDKDCKWVMDTVNEGIERGMGPVPNANQFAAMNSLTFNIGRQGFLGSTVLRKWNEGKVEDAAQAFHMWNRDKFGVNTVLVGRRAREAALFLTPMPGSAMAEAPMPQAPAPPPTAVASKTAWIGGVGAAAGAASVADQVSTVATSVNAATMSVRSMGAVALSVIVVAAIVFMLVRYIIKVRNGQVQVK